MSELLENLEEDCPICCCPMDIATTVKCTKCNGVCCQECFQHYIVTCGLDSTCMHCKEKIEIDFIILNTNNKWFCKIYKKQHREMKLWLREISLLQDIMTQKAASAYLDARGWLGSTSQRIASRTRKEVEYYTFYYGTDNHQNEDPEAMIVANCKICIDQYGKGWEDHDFEKNETRPITTFKISFSCPTSKCRGIVIDEKCNLCERTICKDCREIMRNDSHECDKNTVASIRAVLQGSHPCPKCVTPISRIEGCDQMFCTQCHTTFSWNTGDIVTHNIHNPHYFRWLERTGQFQLPERLNNENNCDEFISYQNLMGCFTPEEIKQAPIFQSKAPSLLSLDEPLPSTTHYFVAFKKLRERILHVRATSGNHAYIGQPDNHDLRIKLLSKEIDETEFKEQIEERDMEYMKTMFYWEIYSAVFELSTILFDNIFTFTHKRLKFKMKKEEFFFKTYYQLQKILEYSNERLKHYNKVFRENEKYILFKRHPFG